MPLSDANASRWASAASALSTYVEPWPAVGARTISMSVFARQNLFEFDKFAYGSAASTFLFMTIAVITIKMNTGRVMATRVRPI